MINLPNIIFPLVTGFLMSSTGRLATTFVRVGGSVNFFSVWPEV